MILVTGAGGNVGTVLVQELKAEGHKPRLAYHSDNKAEQARGEGYDVVLLDFEKRETLSPALAGVEKIFLLGTGGRGQAEREINVVDAAKAAGVKRLVKLSIWGAADEQYSLAKIHRVAERAVEASGLDWTFLRPNGFADYMLDLFRIYRSGAAEKVTPWVKAITGREPTSFEEFARDYEQAFR